MASVTRNRLTLGAGIHADVPESEYHSDPDSLSSTFVRLLTDNVPAKALAKASRPPTKAMNAGKFAHSLWLGSGPSLVVWQYDGRTREGKEERADYAEAIEREAVVAVNASEYETVMGMVSVLHNTPEIVELWEVAQKEVSAFWLEGDTWCRARFDLLSETDSTDYKTCQDASAKGFAKSMAVYGYHQQEDWYRRGLSANGHRAGKHSMRFICQETASPYLVQIHTPDEGARMVARELNDRALRVYQEAKATGVWAGLEPLNAPETPLPPWYFYQHETELDGLLANDDEIRIA